MLLLKEVIGEVEGGETKDFDDLAAIGLRRLTEVFVVGLIGAAERGDERVEVVPGPDWKSSKSSVDAAEI